jgi:iron complex outermembrane receptor protein
VTVPGLGTAPYAGREGTLNLTMRGIATSDPSPGTLDAAVAVIVDDVYNARGIGMDLNVAEVDRIEVLRGPQGTLFGRNAVGGAIRIITKRPTEEFGGNVKVGVGNFGEQNASAHLNTGNLGPLRFKLDYSQAKHDGYVDNPSTTSDLTRHRDFGELDGWGGKFTAELQATDNLLFSYSYSKSDIDRTVLLSQHSTPPALCQGGIPCIGSSVFVGAPFEPTDKYPDKAWIGQTNDVSTDTSDDQRFSIDWQINDNLALKSISTYSDVEALIDGNTLAGAYALVSFGGLPFGGPITQAALGFDFVLPPAIRGNGLAAGGLTSSDQVYGLSAVLPWSDVKSKSWSQEFQLSGSTDTLKWVTGAYYFKEDVHDARYTAWGIAYTGYDGTRPINPVPIDPVALQPRGFPGENNTLLVTEADVQAWALFAQGTWTPASMERLHTTLGLRYSDENRTFHRSVDNGIEGDFPGPDFTLGRVDGTLSIAYDLTDTTNVYARYATAYRSGGATVRTSWADPETLPFSFFDEEEVAQVELGIKTDLFDNRLRLNAATYYTEDKGTIYSVQLDPTNVSVTGVINLPGTTEIKGVELEAVVAATDNLRFSGNLTLQDYKFDDAVKELIATNEPGSKYYVAPFPDWNAYLGADYTRAMGMGELGLHLDYSKSDWCQGTPRIPAGNYNVPTKIDTINGRVSLSGIEVGGLAFTVALFGKNLADKAYPSFSPTAGQFVLNTPLTYGIELSAEF